jgi:CBS domain-containing protein/sporulation protein YlmC with PRC-barrel domain
MAFVSELMDKPVTDIDGRPVGTLKDLVARQWKEFPHPVIDAIVVARKSEQLVIPFSAVAVLIAPAIPLNCHLEDIPTYVPGEDDIFLVRDVLDKQIIDTNGARVVRVNDLELVRVTGKILVSNVDVGGKGLLRRAGLARLADGAAGRLKLRLQNSFISWDDVELLRHDQFMRLKFPGEALSELHPADVAEIISDLNRLESGQLLESLDIEHLADTLEEVEPDFQASLIKDMPDEKVADVLEEMSPDEAADLLAELPRERSEDLLELMEDEEADDVRKLLAYPEDSAGGIMTTDYACVKPGLTTEQAIQALREAAEEPETIFYVYVTDDEDHLLGVFSLSRLILSPPDALVDSFMQKRVVSVKLLDEQETVAQLIAKYDLLAIPVVDDENRLHGIVTSDDALDKIIPTAWKKRLPRFYR